MSIIVHSSGTVWQTGSWPVIISSVRANRQIGLHERVFVNSQYDVRKLSSDGQSANVIAVHPYDTGKLNGSERMPP